MCKDGKKDTKTPNDDGTVVRATPPKTYAGDVNSKPVATNKDDKLPAAAPQPYVDGEGKGTRRELCQSLGQVANMVDDEPWLVLGDFNTVADMSEVCGALGDIRRPDWMLVNDWWLNLWPEAYYISLMPSTSDHSPLVLKGNLSTSHRNKADLSLNVKLAGEYLASSQTLLQSNSHNSLLLYLEHCCRLVYMKVVKLEQIMLEQRAKIQWLKGGDQCSQVFFHKVASSRAVKKIFQITDGTGRTRTDEAEIVEEFIGFYQCLLGNERKDRYIDFRYLRPWARHIVTNDEANQLIRPMTKEEVKLTFFHIAEDKSPGPDGYSSGFYKAAWPVIGDEVTRAVLEFFTTGRLLKQVNTTLLALIPKVQAPSYVADFGPISCCNVLYKAITKIIVQCIRLVLDHIISPFENAFVPGRSIEDNILLAQELFMGYNQQRLPLWCALKVDLRKDYDTVEWDFLLASLQLFGFSDVFIKWIQECISTTTFSVCLNGNTHDFFKGARGLRQGDLMFHYLFVLVMEVLSMLLQRFIEQESNFSYHWRCRDVMALNYALMSRHF
ncbi:UNVERIFIED_CONTAM: hypothetical protein Slati_2400600 [Sesamum latifolium]|uniref:Reverse transcriptase domain-containing protein n=1 Tax=Sesamum latifolium TaxID=2727402 RepID=A0AAW2WD21_9LAMI